MYRQGGTHNSRHGPRGRFKIARDELTIYLSLPNELITRSVTPILSPNVLSPAYSGVISVGCPYYNVRYRFIKDARQPK